MKYINRISVLLSLLTVLLFSACSTDQEGPLYTEGGGAGSYLYFQIFGWCCCIACRADFYDRFASFEYSFSV